MVRRNKMIRLSLMAAVSVMLLAGSGITYASSSAGVHNTFETGAVKIKLDEYHIDDDGKEIPYDDSYGENVLPGQKVSKIVRITNQAAECYIRARIICQSDDESWKLDPSDIKGTGSEWVTGPDGNYYLRESLASGKNAELFTEVDIPQDIPQTTLEGKNFRIVVEVDAVQKKNFSPDYTLASPWGDVRILNFEGADDYSVSEVSVADRSVFRLLVDDGTKGIRINTKDLFSNMPVLMPGDSYSDILSIRNTGETAQTIMFRADKPSENSLSEKVHLSITRKKGRNRKKIYDGTADLNKIKKISLVKLSGGEKASLEFTVSLPSEADNSAALQKGYVNWHFSAVPDDKHKPDISEKKHKDDSIFKADIADKVQTGIENNFSVILFAAGIVMATITVAVCVRDRSCTEEE